MSEDNVSETKADVMPDYWGDDQLGRREDALYVDAFIKARLEERGKAGKKKSYVLNLDAGWGRGKTYFLERFAKEAQGKRHLVAYVNAWRDDFSDDPLVPVMSSIDAALAVHIKKKRLKNLYGALKANLGPILVAMAIGAAGQAAKRLFGDEFGKVGRLIGGNPNASGEPGVAETAVTAAGETLVQELSDRFATQAMNHFTAARKSVEDFRTNLEKLLQALKEEGIPMPLYVLVDELDRCRPPFAIAMLERIKHLFEANNVAFVVATDTDQLQHSIKAVYGSDFASATYLKRFFDRTYRFDQPDTKAFVQYLMTGAPIEPERLSAPIDDHSKFLADTFDYFGASLREIEQSYDLIRTVCTTWSYTVPLQLGALLPLVLAVVRAIEPQYHSDLIKNLEKGRPSGWQGRSDIGYRIKKDSHLYNSDIVTITPDLLFHYYINLYQKSLNKLTETLKNCNILNYVHTNYLEEIQKLYKGFIEDNSYSIVQSYPEIIRKAGRLK